MSTLIRNGNKIGGGISELEKLQIYELPTPSAAYAGKIYQYVGATNEAFTNGFFYKCELNSNDNYVWREVKTSSIISDTGASTEFAYSSQRVQTLLDNKADTATTYSKIEVDSRISAQLSSALKYKGKVATVAALPVNVENGDSYIVEADDLLYAWNDDNSQWDALGGITDLTNYYTKTEVDQMFADMADKFQYSTVPTASSTTVGKIIQYTGADTNDYKNGYWYKCIDNGDSTYSWIIDPAYYTNDVIDALHTAKYYNAANAPDCDTLTEIYVLVNAGNSYVENHYPAQDLFFVKTIYSDTDTDTYQTAIAYGAIDTTQKGIMYSRVKTSGTWASWKKLATTDSIYKTVSTGFLTSAGENHWFIVDNLYPLAGLQTATYVINGRNGGSYIMSCGTTDDANKLAPTITTISSGSNPLVGFNYDLATGKVELQSNQYNTLFITQISGVRNDFTIKNETNTPQLSTAGVIETIATTALPTLNGTCKGLADSECYATFDVTFDSWGGSSPAIIGIAVDGAYVNSKALIMVNNSIDTASDKKVRILYADGVNCLFRVYASKSSLYSNTVTVYVSFYTSEAQYDYNFKVQQRDYIGTISNLNVTNDSTGMPVSSWFQAITQPSAPVLTTDLTSTVSPSNLAPVTSDGVYGELKYQTMPSDLNNAFAVGRCMTYSKELISATELPSNSPTFSKTPDYSSASMAIVVITDAVSNYRIIQRCEVTYFATTGNWVIEGYRRVKIDNTWFGWAKEWEELH